MGNKLFGIDVSAWQTEDVYKADGDFLIAKATEGTSYLNAKLSAQIGGAFEKNKLIGLYHFASGLDAKTEAAFFIKATQMYKGNAVLVLDYEGSATAKGREWCRAWMQEVKRLTGVMPWLYSYYAAATTQKLPELCTELGAGFWLAQYWDTNQIKGFNPPAKGPALACDCWQYTSNGLITGYPDRLDCNIFYGDRAAWLSYAAGNQVGAEAVTVAPDAPPTSYALPKAGMTREEVGLLQAAIGTKVDYIWGPDSERKYNAWRPIDKQLGRIRRGAATQAETKWAQYVTGTAIDGKWQTKTDDAVKAKQKAAGLNSDAWIGPKTLTAWGYR